jgi:hypothetical protein
MVFLGLEKPGFWKNPKFGGPGGVKFGGPGGVKFGGGAPPPTWGGGAGVSPITGSTPIKRDTIIGNGVPHFSRDLIGSIDPKKVNPVGGLALKRLKCSGMVDI